VQAFYAEATCGKKIAYNGTLPAYASIYLLKTNILVGGRFHSVMLADTLREAGIDVDIYSSAPPRKFRSSKFEHTSHFVPMFASIASRVTPLSFSNFESHENWLFDRVASFRMRECDILHGWAGYSLASAKRMKARGSSFLLERSCPHFLLQEKILESESQKLQLRFDPKPKWWVERCLQEYDLADVIIVPSMYSYRSFIEESFNPKKIVIVPLDRPVLPASPRKTSDKKTFVAGCVGGSIVRKGFVYLLEAWKQLELKDAKLLLKADEKQLRQSPVLAKLLDECANVEVTGYFPDINDFYAQCDVFCLPSVDDGFGMVMTEALSNSIPVIVTMHVGASELIQGKKVGFVIPPRDSSQLAERLQFFYSNRDALKEFGSNAYQFVEELRQEGSRYEKAIKDLYMCHLSGLRSSKNTNPDLSTGESGLFSTPQ
jgi:glycosyltransferase involved in cell wall biosynthesis